MTALLAAFLISVSGDMPPPPHPPVAPAAQEEEVPPEHRLTVEGCDFARGACIVSIEELTTYIKKRVEIAKKLEALAASKGCAKVEVAPKIKFKRDRDA